MGVGDKLWDALTTVIKMNDRIVSQSEQMKAMQAKIEDLTARVIRLETALEIALATQSRRSLDRKS
ncbi:MAG TPA: hypothetical protein VEK05_06680 [Burkholderiales bacterium]|nr:hypothetical protein [Burkholderiales bacterium]